MSWWKWPLIAVGAWLIDRLLLAAEARGWLYYRRNKPSGGAVGAALFQIHAIFQPEKQHIVEQQREIREDADDESGKPPPPMPLAPPLDPWMAAPDSSQRSPSAPEPPSASQRPSAAEPPGAPVSSRDAPGRRRP